MPVPERPLMRSGVVARLLSMISLPAAMLFSLSMCAPACAAPTRTYVRIGPPAAIVAVRPVAPGPRYVWIDGYHRWNGRAYVWVPGRWAMPPRGHAVWVPGRWHEDRHGWYFVEGHWR